MNSPISDTEGNEVVRRFIRHPSDYPISYSLGDSSAAQRTLKDVSSGGLCFSSEKPLPQGESVHIKIPIEPPGFEADGVVAWCKAEDDHYAVGVEFVSDSTAFSLRMIEQVCHIEHYRNEVEKLEGRVLSSEEAAEEWVQKFAGDFPQH